MTDTEPKTKAGTCLECTVKIRGYCSGGMCAMHGVCPHEKAILEMLTRDDTPSGS